VLLRCRVIKNQHLARLDLICLEKKSLNLVSGHKRLLMTQKFPGKKFTNDMYFNETLFQKYH
jgi:hypothetical protein